MAKDDDVSIFDELDDRLDDFFADDDELFNDDEFSEEVSLVEEVRLTEDLSLTEDESLVEEESLAIEDDFSTEAVGNKKIVEDSDNSKISQPSMKIDESTTFDSENPLHQLKIIVLEMDWEISDENLEKYLSEINNLIVHYQNDRPIYLFFKLHAAIGVYMLKKKARAHPEALKFLYGVYNSLENALSDGIPLVEKNKLILAEVNNFKFLKKKLFPGFYPEENEESIITETESPSDDSSFEKDEIKSDSFDISALPDHIQKDVNKYIEKMISKKIDSID